MKRTKHEGIDANFESVVVVVVVVVVQTTIVKTYDGHLLGTYERRERERLLSVLKVIYTVSTNDSPGTNTKK